MLKFLLIGLLIFGCSSWSKNMVKEGNLIFRGGRIDNHQWKDSLIFKRTSWYKELTLVSEILITEVDKNSPFYDWFSASEKRSLEECKQKYVVAAYFLDGKGLSKEDFLSQAFSQGLEKKILSTFEKQLRMHPDSELVSFGLYKVFALCSNFSDKKDIIVNFPGYNSIKL